MNRFSIIVLGASGSGKTCLLASMYNRLAVQREDIGFFLEPSDFEQHKKLVTSYRDIENFSDEKWPSGTVEEQRWIFSCSIRTEDKNYKIFEFMYLDYAGKNLTEDTIFNIVNEAKEATAILVLLDGVKILRILEERWDKLKYPLHLDLNFILPIIEQIGPKPLHFVITKWDVLENKYSLEQIRKKLLEYENFSSIIDQSRYMEAPVRLIPTSSVGKGFAILTEDNNMKKNPKVMAKPFQVEIPIACALIDGFHFVQRNLDKKQRDYLFNKENLIKRMSNILGIVEPIILPAPFNQIPLSVLRGAINQLEKWVNCNIHDIEVDIEKKSIKITNSETAMLSLIYYNRMLTCKLERDFPQSNLFKI